MDRILLLVLGSGEHSYFFNKLQVYKNKKVVVVQCLANIAAGLNNYLYCSRIGVPLIKGTVSRDD
jgi:hypothetical protein